MKSAGKHVIELYTMIYIADLYFIHWEATEQRASVGITWCLLFLMLLNNVTLTGIQDIPYHAFLMFFSLYTRKPLNEIIEYAYQGRKKEV